MNILKHLPTKSYILHTNLSVDEVKIRILTCIQPKPKNELSSFQNHFTRQYEGKLMGDVFKISQVIVGRRNSFAPLITGKLENDKDETRVLIKMEFRSFVIQFMAIWICFTGFLFVLFLIVSTSAKKQSLPGNSPPLFLFPLVLLVFGIYLPVRSFKTETENSKEFLSKFLEEISDNSNQNPKA